MIWQNLVKRLHDSWRKDMIEWEKDCQILRENWERDKQDLNRDLLKFKELNQYLGITRMENKEDSKEFYKELDRRGIAKIDLHHGTLSFRKK